MRKILVVGSWAKEQITVENIVHKNKAGAYAYMDTPNPGIMALAREYRIGSLKDTRSITDYAVSLAADLVLVTTASPLAAGLVDSLRDEGIRAFGPVKSAARLESDKAFTRGLLAKYCPDTIPEYGIFNSAEEAISFAKDYNWQVAVKSVGLSEGLGVKVFGEQMKDEKQVCEYIREVLQDKNNDKSRVIVEEKIQGEEFTVQCLVNNEHVLAAPAVQDFKKLLPGDKGPNTASMGSYAGTGMLLPFMGQADYDKAIEIIKATIKGFREYTGDICQGFLYGQFMLTEKGIKLVEYNFRPGDPEWINSLFTFRGNLLDAVDALIEGDVLQWQSSGQASVCKYIVPEGYPEKLNLTLPVSFDTALINRTGARLYYSCGRDEQGILHPGKERGLAIIASSGTIEEASRIVEEAVSTVEGKFVYRKDIGSEQQIEQKRKKSK